ncbi:hypothetical protein CDD83_8396 [Cordyceps sp. RAO-2017]|nr:hypothetical protein CDD83_8396 [Cordyceps sp. RAO-2017]
MKRICSPSHHRCAHARIAQPSDSRLPFAPPSASSNQASPCAQGQTHHLTVSGKASQPLASSVRDREPRVLGGGFDDACGGDSWLPAAWCATSSYAACTADGHPCTRRCWFDGFGTTAWALGRPAVITISPLRRPVQPSRHLPGSAHRPRRKRSSANRPRKKKAQADRSGNLTGHLAPSFTYIRPVSRQRQGRTARRDCMSLGIEIPLPPGPTASDCTTHRLRPAPSQRVQKRGVRVGCRIVRSQPEEMETQGVPREEKLLLAVRIRVSLACTARRHQRPFDMSQPGEPQAGHDSAEEGVPCPGSGPDAVWMSRWAARFLFAFCPRLH